MKRYQFIELYKEQYCVSLMCRVLQVARSGYYRWRNTPVSRRSQENGRLELEIKAVFEENRGVYGSPRVHQELRARGVACGEKLVARLMHKTGLRAVTKRAFRKTTDSRHGLGVTGNLLNREFVALGPNQKWCSDITYIRTKQGWMYLAVVLDLYSRRVVGWALRPHMECGLVCAAFAMAQSQRLGSPESTDLLHHSDQGTQYASGEYQALLQKSGARCSMSRKGDCWDNAPMESFFATLKRELVFRTSFTTHQEALKAVFEYIEVFYNQKRRHSALGYLSPVAFEETMLKQKSA